MSGPVLSNQRKRAVAMGNVANGHTVVPVGLAEDEDGSVWHDESGKKALTYTPRWQTDPASHLTTPEAVRRHWDEHPDHYPAIVTEASGVVLVDQDGDDAEGWWAKHGEPGHAQPSVSGRLHHYFAARTDHPVKCSAGEVAPGIDTRGVGGLAFVTALVPRAAELRPAPGILPRHRGGAGAPMAEPVDRPAAGGPEDPEPFEMAGATFAITRAEAAARLREMCAEIQAAPAKGLEPLVGGFLRECGRYALAGALDWRLAQDRLQEATDAHDATHGLQPPAKGWDWTVASKAPGAKRNAVRDQAGLTPGTKPVELYEPPVAATAEPAEPHSWQPVDMGPVVRGERDSIRATIGQRSDGVRLLYPGREHSVASEPESGKTWLLLHIVGSVLAEGGRVVYVDFEDDEGGIGGRALALGIPAETLTDLSRFRYVRPEAAPTPEQYAELLDFDGAGPTLVCLDGVTEGYALFGGEVNSQESAAKWRAGYVKPALRVGAATVSTDHVVKNKEGRNGYAIGAQHKKAGLNGALLELVNVDPFGRGLRGHSQVMIHKDRNGDLRRHGIRVDGERSVHFADLVMDATQDWTEDGSVELELTPPAGSTGDGETTDPLGWVKADVAKALDGRAMTARDLRAAVNGGNDKIDKAVMAMHAAGLVCRRETVSATGRVSPGPWHLTGQCTEQLHPDGVPQPRGMVL